MKKPESNTDDNKPLTFQRDIDEKRVFAEIYRKFVPIARKYLAELDGCQTCLDDLTQEVFVRLWKHRDRFRGDSTILTYLFAVARNIHREQQNVSKATTRINRFYSLDLLVDPSADIHQREVELQRQDLVRAIEQAKARLSDKQRQAIDMIYFQGMPGTEAAKLAECSCQAFRNRLYQAKKHLRELLSNCNLFS